MQQKKREKVSNKVKEDALRHPLGEKQNLCICVNSGLFIKFFMLFPSITTFTIFNPKDHTSTFVL